MVYGDIAAVRKLSGNPSVQRVPDSDITEAVEYGTAMVNLQTGKSIDNPWTSGDAEFPLIKEAANYFATSWIRDRFEDKEKTSDEFYQKALDICALIVRNSKGTIIIRSSPYKTYPLNPDADVYRSVMRSGFGIGTDHSQF